MESIEGRIEDIRFNGKPESCMAEVICRQAIVDVLEHILFDSGEYNLGKVADLLMAAMIDWDAERPPNLYGEETATDETIACALAFVEGQNSMKKAGWRKVRSEGGN